MTTTKDEKQAHESRTGRGPGIGQRASSPCRVHAETIQQALMTETWHHHSGNRRSLLHGKAKTKTNKQPTNHTQQNTKEKTEKTTKRGGIIVLYIMSGNLVSEH
jgi:predicted S18 family serine protease